MLIIGAAEFHEQETWIDTDRSRIDTPWCRSSQGNPQQDISPGNMAVCLDAFWSDWRNSLRQPQVADEDGRHPGAGSAHGSALRAEATSTLATDVQEPPERQGAVLLLPTYALGQLGAMDQPAHARLQLPARPDGPESQQVAGLLLPCSSVQKRHAATTSADATGAASVTGGVASWDDDDGEEQRPRQELWRPHQEQRTAVHVRHRPHQVLGGREERGQRVGRLPRRERQSPAEEQSKGRGRVPADPQVHGEPVGRWRGGAHPQHLREGRQCLSEVRGEEERQTRQTTR